MSTSGVLTSMSTSFFRTLDVVHSLIQEHDDFLTMTPKRKYRDFDPSTIPSDRCLPQINLPRLSLTRLPRCTWIILDYFTTAPNCSNVTLLSQHKYSHIDFDLRFLNCQLLICSLGLFKPLPLNVILRFRIVVVRFSAPTFKKLLFALRCPLKFPNISLSTLKDVNLLNFHGSCLQRIEAHICAANSTSANSSYPRPADDRF